MRKPVGRAYNRDVSWRKATSRKKMSDAWMLQGWDPHSYYDNLHEYSKGKVHCSCGMCSRYTKTNNKGRHRKIHGNYALSYNPPMKDKRRLASMDDDEIDSLVWPYCDESYYYFLLELNNLI